MRVGLDLVEVARLRRILEKHPSFAPRTYTPAELAQAAECAEIRLYEFLAGRFAVKEAVLKALGTGLSGGIAMTEIEVGTAPSGAPVLRIRGEALRMAVAEGLTRYETSISHDAGIAAAIVVLT